MELTAPPHKLLTLLTQWQICLHTYIAMNRARWWYCPMALWKESKSKWKQKKYIIRGWTSPEQAEWCVYSLDCYDYKNYKKLINKSSRSHPIKTHLDPVGKLLAVLPNKGSLHCVLQVPEQRFCPCDDYFFIILTRRCPFRLLSLLSLSSSWLFLLANIPPDCDTVGGSFLVKAWTCQN